MTDDLLDVPNCPQDLHAMEPVGNVREVVTEPHTAVEGSAWWQCTACGLTPWPDHLTPQSGWLSRYSRRCALTGPLPL